jgi:RHS repeat-associated protein
VVARYTQGRNVDEPLVMLRGTTTDYYEQDGLGSITSLSDTTGALAQTYTYDSFGNTVATTGALRNYFQYTGREFDSETSLYFYRARYYDPQSGRFLREDPAGFEAGTNFYTYTLNQPMNFTDPLGLDVAVIENGPTEDNPIGHTAICVTGAGVFSFGNDTTGFELHELH